MPSTKYVQNRTVNPRLDRKSFREYPYGGRFVCVASKPFLQHPMERDSSAWRQNLSTSGLWWRCAMQNHSSHSHVSWLETRHQPDYDCAVFCIENTDRKKIWGRCGSIYARDQNRNLLEPWRLWRDCEDKNVDQTFNGLGLRDGGRGFREMEMTLSVVGRIQSWWQVIDGWRVVWG